nr:DNA polymerase III subunit gamma/tau [Shewanella dokdonensis]
MSYQVLARKWRPASFEQVVGQSHVLHALTNALSQQRLHHAYLFTGTRGVGKTSLARLFAKGLNCEQGITATPCGKCSACQEIAQGRFVDLIEVDAASRTKVDDTRELLDNVQYRPTRGRFKVYLIDEVHMLSRSSFNALLKTLEEPPEHVKFLLATTDPQKLPVTVLSRCLQFNLKSLTQDEIAKQLQHIVTEEALPFEPSALALLAKAANGSMRDALSLTDQAIAFGAGQIKLQQVQTMLGAIDERQVISLLQALVQADIAPLLQEADRILAFGADANEVLRSLLELLHQITLTQFAPAAAQLSLYATQIQEFAEQLAAEQVQLYYQLLLQGRKDLPFAPDPKSGLEMALLRAVAFVPETPPKRWQSTATHADKPVLTAAEMTPVQAVPALPQSADNLNANPSIDTSVAVNAEPSPVAAHMPREPVDDDEDTACVAEQTLILSQAESLGHQYPSAELAEETATEDEAEAEVPFRDELTSDMFAAEPHPQATEWVDEPQTTAATALFGDELLEQVLATREQLLQDIDALAADDEPVNMPERHSDAASKKR